MTDETTTPSPEVVNDAPTAPAPDSDDALLGVLDAEGGEEDTGSDEVEYDEVEYEGKTYRVPKEVAPALLRQADYTRKTQEVAEQRRALEAKTAEFQQAAVLQQQFAQDYAQISTLGQRLAQFEGVDWTRLADDDPVAAQKLFFEYQKTKDVYGSITSQVQQRQAALAERHRAAHGKLVEEGRQALAREIKGWSPELAEDLVKYATGQGVSEREVRGTVSAAHIKILNKARMYDQLMAKAAARKSDAQPAEPAPTVSGRSASTVNPGRMSTEEWMRWRSKQIARG